MSRPALSATSATLYPEGRRRSSLRILPPINTSHSKDDFLRSPRKSRTPKSATFVLPPTPEGREFTHQLLLSPDMNGHANGNGKILARRPSAPMMPPMMVSAPGKVIVFGEHAVVHGKKAIAAAISLRSYLLVTFLSKTRRSVSLRFPDVGLSHSWNIDDLPWQAFAAPGKKKYYYDLVTSLDEELVEALQPHIQSISPKQPEQIRKIHQASASAFLYLFLSLGSPKSPPCVYTLRSTIPIGAGLGSSASIAVCLATALLLQIRALSGPHEDQPSSESELQIQRINHWAFVAECAIHGNPSGVDNTVSSGGKAVLFQRTDYAAPPKVTPLRSFPELPLLLVDTRQSRSTSAEVAKVATLKKTHPIIADNILNSIHDVTESAHTLITKDDFELNAESLQHLGELITINHGLLVSLGVSHPKLERIRALIDHTGIGWTKLTGAGGGGCAITIVKPKEDDEVPRAPVDLENTLIDEGFQTFRTTLAGDGVGVLWPAVLHNGLEEEGGTEIDQEKFLNAEGTEGVETLVGVSVNIGNVNAVREGWRFWRP